MEFLEIGLYALHVLSCIILIVVVLLHEAKGDSLAAVFGGGGMDSAFGVQFGKRISRFTIMAAVAFMAIGIGMGIWTNKGVAPETIESSKAPMGTPATPAGGGESQTPEGQAPAGQAPGAETPTPAPAGDAGNPQPAPENK